MTKRLDKIWLVVAIGQVAAIKLQEKENVMLCYCPSMPKSKKVIVTYFCGNFFAVCLSET